MKTLKIVKPQLVNKSPISMTTNFESNSIYIRYSNEVVEKTCPILIENSSMIMADIDENNQLVGIEVVNDFCAGQFKELVQTINESFLKCVNC